MLAIIQISQQISRSTQTTDKLTRKVSPRLNQCGPGHWFLNISVSLTVCVQLTWKKLGPCAPVMRDKIFICSNKLHIKIGAPASMDIFLTRTLTCPNLNCRSEQCQYLTWSFAANLSILPLHYWHSQCALHSIKIPAFSSEYYILHNILTLTLSYIELQLFSGFTAQ